VAMHWERVITLPATPIRP